MTFVYVLICDQSEWEDLVVFLSREEALEESIRKPNHRVEIFSKTDNSGYTPTYNYYKNGHYIQSS
jgi:hypothetical protein